MTTTREQKKESEDVQKSVDEDRKIVIQVFIKIVKFKYLIQTN